MASAGNCVIGDVFVPTNAVMERGVLRDQSNRVATRSSSKALGKDHALSRRRSARLALQENALPSREVVNSQSSEANQRKKRNSSSSRGTSTGLRDRVAKRARCVNGGTDIRASCSRSQNSLQRTSLAIHSDEQETITSKKRRSSGSRASSTPVEAEISSRNNFVNEDDYCLRPLKFDPSKLTRRIAPHDARNRYDVLEASDYVTDIFQRLFAAEESFQARPYLEQKEGITPRMRSILVDWLVQVQHKLNFVTETLYLAVSLFDRYVSQVEVSRNRLQLVGVTALLIASKYEDIFPPEVKELVYICDRAYTHQDLLDMEIEILKVLQYRVSGPTAYPFMCRFLTMMQVETNSAVWFGSNYYLDRMLQEANSLEHRPSLLALGSVVLALNNHDLRSHDGLVESTRPGIPSLLLNYSCYSESQVLQVASLIAEKVRRDCRTASGKQLCAVYKKYHHRKFLHISSRFDLPKIEDVRNANAT